MKKIAKGLIGLFLIFMIIYSSSGMGRKKYNSEGIREGYESEYYYAFTEATRYMIYQYYNQAVGLYKSCLEYNPGSAAIKYQLSKDILPYRICRGCKKIGT